MTSQGIRHAGTSRGIPEDPQNLLGFGVWGLGVKQLSFLGQSGCAFRDLGCGFRVSGEATTTARNLHWLRTVTFQSLSQNNIRSPSWTPKACVLKPQSTGTLDLFVAFRSQSCLTEAHLPAEWPNFLLGFYQGYLKLPGLELIYIYVDVSSFRV